MKKDNPPRRQTIEETLNRLYLSKRRAPKAAYLALILLYLLAVIIIGTTAGSAKDIIIAGQPVPIYTFAGVLSSLSNICVIFLAVYFGKAGIITSFILLLGELPMILTGIFVRHNMTSLPGVFGNVLALVAVVFIYLNNKKLDEYEKVLRTQAVTDMLTGLPNWFAVTELIDALVRRREPFAVVSIDMNGFKSINDTMGFETGNKVLIDVSQKWKNIADNGISSTLDFISRLNGDEFALVIRRFRSQEDILDTIKKYEEVMNDQMNSFGYDFYISASFGYAIYPEDSDNMDSLISYADMAMQEIKKAGSGEHILKFMPELLKNEHTLEMEGKLHAALDNDNIFFMLQPQYDMSHKLRGFEALARMRDDDGAILQPHEFIPVAEKVGLIDKIDSVVFKKAAAFVGELSRQHDLDVTLSVNVSVRHLMKKDFTEEIKNQLAASRLPANRLEIEITESVMIESLEKAMDCIKELRNMGVQIAIDDFGTGYSSLSYLNDIPANLLKIDKTFVDGVNSSEKSKQYVAAIISLGHIMGYKVISEGVEENDQLEILKQIGCDYIQGFIWGRPLMQNDVEKLVAQQ